MRENPDTQRAGERSRPEHATHGSDRERSAWPCATMTLLALGGLSLNPQGIANAQGTLPPDEEYVVARHGRLELRGQPIRFWGAIGNFPGPKFEKDGDPYAGQRLTLQRLQDMGFNMVRFWHYGSPEYTKGDGSERDRVDFFLSECRNHGIYIWAAGLGGGLMFEEDIEPAAAMVDDPASAEEWKQAVRSLLKDHWKGRGRKVVTVAFEPPVVWDPRLEAWAIEAMRRRVQHINQHNGLRYSDDPVNAIWELTNEQWWMTKMTRGAWQKLPPFFKRSLLIRWHDFLRNKYGDEAGLTKAWGFLLPGESLSRGTVLLAPLGSPGKPVSFNDTNPEALAAFEGVAQPLGRDDFKLQRGADVLEFFTGLLVAHKQRFAAALKTWGKSCALGPVVLDTGIGESIQAQFMQQHGDAIAHCAYMEGFEKATDPADRLAPFYSILERYPRLCKDVPWLEHNRHPDKPFLAYETQMGNPGKYRAEFPMRLAALGSIQDWSAVCFHYWTVGKYDYSKPNPFEGPLSHPGSGAYQYDYTFDEIAFAARRAAGEVFKHHLLRPAPQPTLFQYGRRSLYHPDSMSYGRSYGPEGLDTMLMTTYRHGCRLVIDPTRDEDEIVGPAVRMKSFAVPTRIRPTDEIEFDTVRSHLVFDAPGVAGYAGFFARYGDSVIRFRNGLALSDVRFVNPEGCPYPVGNDEQYVVFTLASCDGLPLAETRRAVLSLVSTSFNTGLALDPRGEKHRWGSAPVLVTRVGGVVEGEALRGMRYTIRNFAMQNLGEGTVEGGRLLISADLPIFLTELSR